jgi:prevent-host-death family protein
MQLLSANYAKTQFGQMIDMAQKEPVRITRHNRVVGVMVSAQDYDDMRAFYANRLKQTLQATATAARERGLTQDKLDELLSDES